jgi:Stress responsive A/B Barrel Domain
MGRSMFNLLQVIHFDPDQPQIRQLQLLELLAAAGRSLPGVRSARVGKTLPRSLNGGDLMWRLGFACERDYWACISSARWRAQITPALLPEQGIFADSLAYCVDYSDTTRSQAGGGIWRCLVMATDIRASAHDVRQLQADLMLMPNHVATIRNWALGHVVSAQGRRRWTHVWEQEFDSVEGLEGEYMINPIHWGVVDGWFDPECPQRIVDPFLIHAAFAVDESVIL